jgi:hypothetical protein
MPTNAMRTLDVAVPAKIAPNTANPSGKPSITLTRVSDLEIRVGRCVIAWVNAAVTSDQSLDVKSKGTRLPIAMNAAEAKANIAYFDRAEFTARLPARVAAQVPLVCNLMHQHKR